jgi:hypothetical protein
MAAGAADLSEPPASFLCAINANVGRSGKGIDVAPAGANRVSRMRCSAQRSGAVHR